MRCLLSIRKVSSTFASGVVRHEKRTEKIPNSLTFAHSNVREMRIGKQQKKRTKNTHTNWKSCGRGAQSALHIFCSRLLVHYLCQRGEVTHSAPLSWNTASKRKTSLEKVNEKSIRKTESFIRKFKDFFLFNFQYIERSENRRLFKKRSATHEKEKKRGGWNKLTEEVMRVWRRYSGVTFLFSSVFSPNHHLNRGNEEKKGKKKPKRSPRLLEKHNFWNIQQLSYEGCQSLAARARGKARWIFLGHMEGQRQWFLRIYWYRCPARSHSVLWLCLRKGVDMANQLLGIITNLKHSINNVPNRPFVIVNIG